MDFPGKFSDHILPDKIHMLNVCFVVNGLEEKFGGTAGNIAYSLALLGERPLVLSCAGKDFGPYEKWLRKLDLPLEGVRRIDEEFTAGAYITTDQADNQITGFNPGAMKHKAEYHIDRSNLGGALAIISPGNVDDMVGYAKTYRELNVPFIFDPGQQIPALGPDRLRSAIVGAKLLVTNDYELEMIMKDTGWDKQALLERVETIITTLGEKGALIVDALGETQVPAAKVPKAADPTGAGDAYRAGLIKGMITGKPLPEACRMGAVAAAYCVEQYGTQVHSYTMDQFWDRYNANFGS
jgi:adenosine kinase